MNETDIQFDERLIRRTIRLNTMLLAGVCGLMSGLALFFATYLSLFRGLPNPGHKLNLLGVFLPGYEVSLSGAWIGLFWGGIFGAVAGAVIYLLYARDIKQQARLYLENGKLEQVISYVTMHINGNALGLALGAITALGLFFSTNWLVMRGTANESVHAALLSNYFPGYTVSFAGSFIGALDIFVLTYLVCLVLGAIYNGVVLFRQRSKS